MPLASRVSDPGEDLFSPGFQILKPKKGQAIAFAVPGDWSSQQQRSPWIRTRPSQGSSPCRSDRDDDDNSGDDGELLPHLIEKDFKRQEVLHVSAC